MKPTKSLLLGLFVILLAACASANPPAAQTSAVTSTQSLVVSGGDAARSYSRADLEALPASQVVFKDVTYKGVALSALLQDAGFDLAQLKAVKAVASDGYTVNYEPEMALRDDVIVAYAQADGELAEEDGTFRMVVPDAQGSLNPRMLVELQVIK